MRVALAAGSRTPIVTVTADALEAGQRGPHVALEAGAQGASLDRELDLDERRAVVAEAAERPCRG